MSKEKPPRNTRTRNLIFMLVALVGIIYALVTL